MTRIYYDWSPAKIEQLTKLWKEGYSVTECAGLLGGFTGYADKGRSAVAGKLDRLGLFAKSIRRSNVITKRPRRAHTAPSLPKQYVGVDPDFEDFNP